MGNDPLPLLLPLPPSLLLPPLPLPLPLFFSQIAIHPLLCRRLYTDEKINEFSLSLSLSTSPSLLSSLFSLSHFHLRFASSLSLHPDFCDWAEEDLREELSLSSDFRILMTTKETDDMERYSLPEGVCERERERNFDSD